MRRSRCFFFPTLALLALAGSPPLGAQDSHPEAGALYGEVLEAAGKGDYSRAERLLSESTYQDAHLLRLSLELASRRGQRERVQELASRLLGLYRQGLLATSQEIGQAAFAAWQLQRWQEANDLFLEASEVDPPSFSMFVDWGRLYLEKYNAPEAEAIFLDALKLEEKGEQRPRWGIDDAYVGLALALKAQNRPGYQKALEQALEANPNNLDALTLQTRAAIENEQWEEAEQWIQRGLKINREYLPLLELQCAQTYFQDSPSNFEKSLQKLLQINPANGRLFELLGDLTLGKRRLWEAVEFYRKAVQLEPRRWSAMASLGINLLRLGQEEEGKRVLEEAYANDPFNLWTVNTLRLLDSFERFQKFQAGRFTIRLHKREAPFLRPYVEELLERSLEVLQAKYGHQIEDPYLLEIYPDHEDFAVRTLGMPGLGALGATFGRVVAMDSPTARPPGTFHWASTFWHELAHVITLDLSRDRVPRWLTEGLSMLEEQEAGEGWGEAYTLPFIEAYRAGELLPLLELSRGFENPATPEQLEVSYVQAGWASRFLAQEFGEAKIREMLVAYGEGWSTEEVFEKVLAVEPEELEERFRRFLAARLDELLPRLERINADWLGPFARQAPDVGGQEVDLEALQLALTARPDNYFLNLAVGRRLAAQGEDEAALPLLEKAIRLFPYAGGEESPYPLLAGIYEKRGDREALKRTLQAWWRVHPNLSKTALQLAGLLEGEGNLDEAVRYAEETLWVSPQSPEVHRTLGRLYLKAEAWEDAIREFQVLLHLDRNDPASSYYGLAKAYLGKGDREQARRYVLLCLEIAPAFEEAQRLLLEIVRP